MSFRNVSATATLVTAALIVQAVALSVVHAQPATPAPDSPGLVYSTKLVDKTVVTTLKGGTFDLTASPDSDPAKLDVVNLKDATGKVLLTLPLRFRLGPVDIPVKPELRQDGSVLALTPDKPAGLTLTDPITVKPVASKTEDDRALSYFTTQFGLATTIGTFVGTALGATVGCVATIMAGCVAGFLTGATVGGIIGTIALGGPTLIASGIDLLTTLQAPDGTTRWADKTTPAPQPAAPQPAPSN
ncbi:hypothetical protein VMT65_29450 [Nocardia sp. CDC153]|uniref:hypothetical protein n=1 Tax=Nocardia sp. CDC153 TaxID=3112167 RepID=UPI002DBEE341|nr:hypothetical protein [Nocardia sp. CDC153]MEC3957191.1 hypothetical protein [Nocardia sp. CDC153]